MSAKFLTVKSRELTKFRLTFLGLFWGSARITSRPRLLIRLTKSFGISIRIVDDPQRFVQWIILKSKRQYYKDACFWGFGLVYAGTPHNDNGDIS